MTSAGETPEVGESSGTDEPSDDTSASDDATDDPSTDSSDQPPKLGPADSGRVLTLRDVRNWPQLKQDHSFADDTYKLGNKSIAAIGGDVSACGDEDPVILDLRPAQQFTKLTFTLGQDADRTSTDSTTQILVAQVLGNDSEVKVTKRAKITSATDVEADIDGVVAAKILLYLDASRCSSNTFEVTAVVADLKLT